MSIEFVVLTTVAGVLGLMTVTWLLSLKLRDTSIIDISWSLGFVLVAWICYLLSPGEPGLAGQVLLACVTTWGLRLAGHIFLRSRGKPEDPRYAAWREEAGETWWWRSYITVFLLQGSLILVISAPLMTGLLGAPESAWPALIPFGALLFGIGFVFEAGADWQLTQFKANPANAGRLLDTGFWSLSRHPNYFGDALQWWGFFAISASTGTWWTLFSPILMSVLIMRVSGVTLLERGTLKDKPGFSEYVQGTSAFFPWFPKGTSLTEGPEHTLERSLDLPLDRARVFGFFSDAGNLERITPTDVGFKILSPQPIDMKVGALIDYEIKLHGLPMSWRTLISVWEPGERFVDEQIKGPYASWVHEHSFSDIPEGTRIDDRVTYRLPLGWLGNLAHPLIRRQLRYIFNERERSIRACLLDDTEAGLRKRAG